MTIADRRTYLRDIVNLLLAQWPNNRTVNKVLLLTSTWDNSGAGVDVVVCDFVP